MNKQAIRFFGTILILGAAAAAHASDKAAVIFPAEGPNTCRNYSLNSLVLEMGTNAVRPGAVGSMNGPDNPNDEDTTRESATYTVTGGKVVGFIATTPIDYALLKFQKNIAFIIYPSGGVYDDANMRLTVDGVDQPIDAISLCYGLGNVPPLPPASLTIPSCDALNAEGGLDGVQIMCPANQARSIVYNFELGESFYSRTGSPIACVCNSAPLQQCDPNVAYDPNNLANNACPRPAENSKNGVEVTTHVELNNDPYTCYTIGGTRTCFFY